MLNWAAELFRNLIGFSSAIISICLALLPPFRACLCRHESFGRCFATTTDAVNGKSENPNDHDKALTWPLPSVTYEISILSHLKTSQQCVVGVHVHHCVPANFAFTLLGLNTTIHLSLYLEVPTSPTSWQHDWVISNDPDKCTATSAFRTVLISSSYNHEYQSNARPSAHTRGEDSKGESHIYSLNHWRLAGQWCAQQVTMATPSLLPWMGRHTCQHSQ